MTYIVTDNCIRCKYTDCVDVCPVECLTITPNADSEADLRAALTASDPTVDQDLFVSAALPLTGRVMIKDEDVCLHCGLCAERCPTGAWDMQKFLYNVAKATPDLVKLP